MKAFCLLSCLLLVACLPGRARALAGVSDSMRVESLLLQAAGLPADSSRTLFFAGSLAGAPYAAGTLEADGEEHLVVCLDRFDCTTFVETVVALTLCDSQGRRSFADFKDNLRCVRYREGRIAGYASRLHYFSDWIYDNERRGIVDEFTDEPGVCRRMVSLNFMTRHAEAYPALRSPSVYRAMLQVEQRWKDYPMPYLPKENVCQSACADIHEGDILAFATAVEGLDVVHVGFACRVGGELHLLHASSLHKRVVVDPLPLCAYLRGKKSFVGVRVVRIQADTLTDGQGGR